MADLNVGIRWSAKTTVHKAWLKWDGILHATGISAHPAQKLSIKLEIDSHPPAGAVCQRRAVTRHRLLALNLYDLPSLMAGKLHALMTRGYSKGRDWYDLLWYLGLRPGVEPNLLQLQNALDQTQGVGVFDARQWRNLAMKRIGGMNAAALKGDVAPFLEQASDAALVDPEHIIAALKV